MAPAAAETTTGLAGLGPADVGHPDIGRRAGRAVDRHDRQLVALAGDRRAEHVVADDHVLLEAGQRGDDVADGVGVAPRRHDFADPGRADDLAQLHRRKVARLVVEPGPDRGVEADVGGADQRLALGRLGRRRGDQLGVTGLDQPGRAAAQQDLAVRQFGHDAETTECE